MAKGAGRVNAKKRTHETKEEELERERIEKRRRETPRPQPAGNVYGGGRDLGSLIWGVPVALKERGNLRIC